MAVTDIFNFAPINEQISTGGQPTPEQFEAARDEGYVAVKLPRATSHAWCNTCSVAHMVWIETGLKIRL